MRKVIRVFAVLYVVPAWALSLTNIELPTVTHADTEVVTNVVFSEFAAESPAWLHDRDWDLMRLSGRGIESSGETFTVGTPLDPTFIMFR